MLMLVAVLVKRLCRGLNMQANTGCVKKCARAPEARLTCDLLNILQTVARLESWRSSNYEDAGTPGDVAQRSLAGPASGTMPLQSTD